MNLILYMTGLLFMLTFFATFLTISSSNPVYAVLGLICLFTFTSCYLILLGLGFIGISYLLIYVGAIAILFLFVVMMMNLKFLTYHLLPNFLPLATVITIFFFFSNFSFFFLFDSFNFFFFSPLNYPWSCLFNSSHHLTSLAYPLYSSFSLWLLFSSLLLLLAMIAPIILILPSSQHSLPNSSCHTSIPASSSHLSTPMKTSVRSFHSQHLSNKIARDLHCHRKGGSPDTSLFYKELMIIEWKIFLIKILIIFSLYIISLLPVDIIIVCFCYAKTIIIGDLIMCAEIPGSEVPLDVDHANIYEPIHNDEIKQTTKTWSKNTCNVLVGIGAASGFQAVTHGVSGNMAGAWTYGTIASACVLAGGLVSMAGDEICRNIDNLPDDHNPERPPSPSVYNSDVIRSPMEPTLWEKITEYYHTLEDNIINNYNIPDIINNYLSTLDNENRVIISIILLVMFALNFYIIKNVKNYMNNKINQKPYNNKYYKMFIQNKNFMNKISNISLNFMIGFCLTFALFGVLMLLFLF